MTFKRITYLNVKRWQHRGVQGHNPSTVVKPAVFTSVIPRGEPRGLELAHAHLVLSGKHLAGVRMGTVCPL